MKHNKFVITGVIEHEEKLEIECVKTIELLFICVNEQKLLITFIRRGK